MRKPLAAVIAAFVGLLGLACSHAEPPAEDPGEKTYHDAVVLFASLSEDTQDLSYRDERFDDVLALCGQVPVGSELRAKADALATRIQNARASAEVDDRESEARRAAAEAAPPFIPNQQAILPTAPPATPQAAPAPEPASWNHASASPLTEPLPLPNSRARPFDPSQPRELPEWYRQKGFVSLSQNVAKDGGASAATAVVNPPAAQAVSPAPAAPPKPNSQATPKPAADPLAPPPVFGLPGPAGQAYVPPQPQ